MGSQKHRKSMSSQGPSLEIVGRNDIDSFDLAPFALSKRGSLHIFDAARLSESGLGSWSADGHAKAGLKTAGHTYRDSSPQQAAILLSREEHRPDIVP